MRTDDKIFKDGSTTYYWSSKFFSEKTRADVLKLYSFVRVADDFVDSIPQDIKKFDKLVRTWKSDKKIKPTSEINKVIINLRDVSAKYNFDEAWIDAFLNSMKMDIDKSIYKNKKETLSYIYGSAEVIGIMMFAILRPDLRKGEEAKRVQNYAKLQGRAMQYINFIRDINEDNELGRCYIPKTELEKYGLTSLNYNEVRRHQADFRELIHAQIALYNEWQKEANKGFRYIPWRERIALRTAVDMYNWTSKKISDDPMVVFDKKIKPSKFRVITQALIRCIYA